METFEYMGKKFTRTKGKKFSDCTGCWFRENGVSCIPKDIPACNADIFIEVKE